ncbi:MarR family transcriptional regulator [Microbacterium sp. cx-55]|uniref:MarR family winged helix-turn-helix transcriptional regulator n=1 Tax=unclassified Microbacterium TaxID=2609290 RepID=UPI001CBD1A3D|nr:MULTISPECIES: MarR family transcriptional regulator [unclassified Microbacterium]MBZ4487244.1 MarR family transcriptional regulator [Microbacterium sp. cx-55]MCC4908639.1 MarR family transcriptional regulator [Microbacterium sp. cx-59]UGB35267.1 MarR family transcriptional regulator [Microbacterium sp. cx-55]
MDHVDRILSQWNAEKPGLDVSPMAVIGRLARTAAVVENRLAATFDRHGIDAGTFDVLATLLRQGPPYEITPAALAAESMVTSSAVAQRLNRLESRGFIARAANPDDGRGKLVRLTDDGRRLVDEVLPEHLAAEEELLADLSPDDRVRLAELLARLLPGD